jgi:hypothetical protein
MGRCFKFFNLRKLLSYGWVGIFVFTLTCPADG